MNRSWTRRGFLGTAMFGFLARFLARAEQLGADEQVLVLPALATAGRKPGEWRVEFHAVVYEREQRRLIEAALRELAEGKLGELTGPERTVFRERIRRFLVDHERGKRVKLEVAGHRLDLGRSGPDGRVKAVVPMSATMLARASFDRDQTVDLDAKLITAAGSRAVRITVHCLAPHGTSVVSDVDDTIKVTNVRDHTEVLRNTFTRPFAAVPGLAEHYRQWAGEGASFHYVSGSPWQLFEPLAEFAAAETFPAGSWHLREFRPKSRHILELSGPPAKHKRSVLVPLLKSLPGRRFILVGDSGEQDPEIYGDLARQFPEQVARILIRDVTGEGAESDRYRGAFRGLSAERWRIFRDPAELGAIRTPTTN